MTAVRRLRPDKSLQMVGLKYGLLTVIARAETPKNGRNAVWECKCDCGNTVIRRSDDLKAWYHISCGCTRRKKGTRPLENHPSELEPKFENHGFAGGGGHPLYDTWKNMLRRCYFDTHRNYHRYGGRGITVCDRWRFGEGGKPGVECFINDMGLPPAPKLSIDRINNDGNYEPSNCRWATQKEQVNNRSPRQSPKTRQQSIGEDS